MIELIPPRRARIRALVVSTWLALGGIALTLALALIVASSVGPDTLRRASGATSSCWNWLAGPSGCFTR